MDELAYAKKAIRIYRNVLSKIWDEVEERPGGAVSSRVRLHLSEAQQALDHLKAQAPAAVDAVAARSRDGLQALEEFR